MESPPRVLSYSQSLCPAGSAGFVHDALSIVTGIGAIIFLLLMAWGGWNMLQQERQSMRRIQRELEDLRRFADPTSVSRALGEGPGQIL